MNPSEQSPVVQPPTPTPVSAPVSTDPGKAMTIGAIILGFVLGAPVGLIISIVAMLKSKKAGHKNTLAFAFIIVFAILTPFVIVYDTNFIIGLSGH
jgi:hypothetical protein